MKKTENKRRIIYYADELNDDFQHTKTNKVFIVDGKYKYGPKNPITKFFAFLLYYFVVPLLSAFMFFIKRTKVVGKKNLKKIKNSGYIIYANHTNVLDAFLGPICVANPKRTFVIVNKDVMSIKGITGLVKALGVFPVPDTASALKNLDAQIKTILQKKQVLTIFPEAHIWPYYTGLRPFRPTSFKFAVKNNIPAVPVAVTYRKPKGKNWKNKKPKITVFIGEPIFPNSEKSSVENIETLKQKTYEFIHKKVINKENYPYITYIKKEKKYEKD